MKNLVLYQSKTGNTKKYAEDIAKAINADIYPLKRFRIKKVRNYDNIIFGGWVMGGNIQGLNKFLADYELYMKDKNIIVFSVGMSYPNQQGREELISQNLLDLYHVRFYQFRGSFDINKLKFPYSWAMKRSIGMMANDPKQAANYEQLQKIYDHPIEFYDQAKVDKVISVIKSLEAQENKASEA